MPTVLIYILCSTLWVLSCVWTTIVTFGDMPGTYNMDFKISYFDCLPVDNRHIKMNAKCSLIVFTIQPCQIWCNNHEHIASSMFQHSRVVSSYQGWSDVTIKNILHSSPNVSTLQSTVSSFGMIWSNNHEHILDSPPNILTLQSSVFIRGDLK